MNQNEVLLSVLCTAFNHDNFIRNTLDGFVMQKTDFAFEVLVHDDASTDRTADIIREYAEKYPHIIKPIIQTENQYSKGVLIMNDILCPLAKGKYLAFCEGDDFWTDKDKLQRQINFLENNHDYVACVHNSTILDCSGQNKDELMVLNNVDHDVMFDDVIFGMRNAYQTSSLVVRKECFAVLPDFYYVATKYGFGDFPCAIWYTMKGKVKFLPYNMSTYRLMSNADSWSASNSSKEKVLKNKEGIITMLNDIKKYVNDERVLLLNKAILVQKFNILEINEKYREMTQDPYREIWNSQSTVFRIKIFIKRYFPYVFKFLKYLKNRSR